jgi:hypothetical protein
LHSHGHLCRCCHGADEQGEQKYESHIALFFWRS